ncbi:MAG: ferrochelatase [Pyrinomonadaceae bacterium]
MTYDALLIVSFGGPEGMDEVLPFLENVLRGRSVPPERMRQVAEHYELFGGVSPINEQNRQLIAALKSHLRSLGPELPIYWGNRNWHPLLADTVRQMRDAGIRRALAFVTSAYSSYSSCRQYRENIAAAQKAAGEDAPRIDKIRPFYNHPLFIQANVASVGAALAQIPASRRSTAELIFTAHSIPVTMAANCDYETQLQETSRLIAEDLKHERYRLVYQSRSGSPAQPWLGPDVFDQLRELKQRGATDTVIAPIGFVSDHMEIIYDLDTKARQLCEELGLNIVRAATAGTHPLFVEMIRQLIIERVELRPVGEFAGNLGARPHVCPEDCCPAAQI